MDDVPPLLIGDLRSGRCVLFVGAGVSVGAGLPDWAAFLRRVADRAGIQWAWGGACDEAQFQLVEAIGRDDFVRLMLPILTLDAPPSPNFIRLCELIERANFAALVSTNWDVLLESSGCCRQVAHLGRDDDLIDSALFQHSTFDLVKQKPLLIKLQGDVSDPSHICVSRLDYSQTLAAKLRFLDRLTRRYSILSIGRAGGVGAKLALPPPVHLSPGAPPILRMREFFVCNDLSDEEKRGLAEQGVTALSYSSRETDWQGNRLYLEKIVACLQSKGSSR
jgi:hypothetical protein